MKLRILLEAEREIESARQYLNEQAPEWVDRFLDDLSSSFAAIAERPESFPALETLPDGWPYKRAILKRFRYAVIYEIVNDEAVVIAVAHTSRDANYRLGRSS